MNQPTILVTGATGKTGTAVVAQLRQRDWPVRAIVHHRDARSEQLDRLGVETVVADMFDPEQLLAAMQGTARAYYVPFFHPFMIQSATAFAIAAREAKLEAIVQMSQWLSSPAHPSLATRQTWLVDHLFAMIPGVTHTIINPGYFADNYLRLISFAAYLGIFPNLVGESLNAPASNEDMARVAVAVLMNPDKHAGKSYRPTGSTLLSADDMVQILSRVLGRTVRRVDLPLWMFLRTARLQGVGAFDLNGFRYYVEDHRQGAFALGAPTNDVLNVTGCEPEDFEMIARRYAASPLVERSFGRRARTWADFLLTPFFPGYNWARYEREHDFPMPAAPAFAIDDTQWKREHAQQPVQSVLTNMPLIEGSRSAV